MKIVFTTKSIMPAYILICLLALASVAQTKPNFTGDWKLNLQKSNSSDGIRMALNHQDNGLTEAFTDFQGGDDGHTVDAK
jgi:hypothetical protein